MSKKTKAEPQVSVQVIVKSLEKESAPLFKQLKSLKAISTKEEFNKAGKLLKSLKNIGKVAKTKEEGFTKPAKQIIANAKTFFAPFFIELREVELAVKDGMRSFLDKQETKVQALEGKLESGEIKRVSTFHKKVGELAVQSEDVGVRSKPVLEITNAKKIPREYLIPDEKKIMQALLDGKEVEGCALGSTKILVV